MRMKRKIGRIGLLVLLVLLLCATVSAVVIGTIAWQNSKQAVQSDWLIAEQLRTPRQAYELCYTYSLDKPQVLEGIESGWEIDNRAGVPKLFTTNNGTISDVMTDEHSRLLRYFNRVTEGRLDLQFKVCYSYGFNGNVLRLCDEDDSDTYYLVTKDNAFWLKTQTGELQQISGEFQRLTGCNVLFRVIIDLDRQTGTTYINNQLCGTYPLTGSAIRYLSFETLDETCNTTKLYGGYIQANYAVYEDFTYPTTAVNCEFTNAAQLSLKGEALYLPSGVTTARSFEALGDKIAFHVTTLLPDGSTGSLALCAGETAVVELETRDGWLYANDRPLKAFKDNLWYDLRIEADMEAQRAVIKVSNQIVDTVDFLVKTNYVDGIRFTNSGSVAFSLDDIMVYNLLDYDVPEPVIPEGADDYTIGINVCSLWENGSHWGWATVTPHDDLKPVLGYYDEGLPETADWEIKYMVEHGIDFQAFCWYAGYSNSPLKSGAKHLDNAFLNAKYSDQMKFCLLWEAANGARPADSAAFRNYYVPFWIENYFSNPNYMRIDNKPVLAIFGANKLIDQFGTGLKDEFDYLREEVKKLGYDGVIILDCHGGRNDIAAYGFDGWYAYNWGSNGYSLGHNQNSNLNVKNARDVYTVPTISVGFNDVGWHQTRNPLMTVSDYEKANKWVRDEYLPNRGANAPSWSDGFVMLSTWNEYGEGTYLMPAEGLNGFGYLDVIREVYTDGGEHVDITPTEEQLERINHNYPQDRRVLRRNGNYVIPESSNKRTFDFTQADAYKTYLSGSNMSAGVTVSANGTTFKTLPAGQSNDAILGLGASMYEGLTADDVTRIRVVASGIPVGQSMQLFFATNGASYSEGNSIRVRSTTTEETTFLFDIGLCTAWTGEITGLRLDPLQVNDTSFTIKSITLELAQDYPELYINGIQMKHTIYPETHDNVDYFPFEPGVSLIQYQLYTYYEWDYAAQTLTLYRDKTSYTFTAGNNYALVNGEEQVPLGGTVYLQDGVPMLPTMGLAKALGLHCAKNGNDYLITTPEASLYDSYDSVEGQWVFNRVGDTRGWGESNANATFTENGLLLEAVPKSDGSYDPMLGIFGLKLDCSKYQTLEICCKWSMSGKSADNLGFYFATEEQPNLSESKRVTYSIGTASDGYQVITFDMSKNAFWTGTLTQLRFDPFDAAGTVEIVDIRFAEAEVPDILLEDDAEGEAKFTLYNDLKLAVDPDARLNQCYHAESTDAQRWLYAWSNVTFTPGVTYQIDFDVRLDPAGQVEQSQLFCNLKYYELGALNNKDHLVKQLDISKSDGWVHYSATWTIPADCTDRSTDSFNIYSNPQNQVTTCYYFDNVKVVAVDGQPEARAVYDLNLFMFGNSLLYHGPRESVGWSGSWGMAASSAEKDYAHRLHATLSEKYGEVPYTISQIANFETAVVAQDNADYSAALASYAEQFKACCAENVPELVTIQMGENVSVSNLTAAQYKNAVTQLISMIRTEAPDCVIVLCTPFWGGDAKIEAVKQIVSEEQNIRVAYLNTLNTNENKAIGLFEHPGVQAHPGDTGMENIAKLIFAEMDVLIGDHFTPKYVAFPIAMRLLAPEKQISLEGGTLKLTARMLPSDADGAVQWSSSDPAVAEVDASGRVTAKADGTAVITVKSLANPNLKESCTITVSGQAPTYTVSYDPNRPNGTTDEVQNMPESDCQARGVTALSTQVPTLKYYLFAGWALTPDSTETVSELNLTGNVTVYAVWRIADRWDFEMEGNPQGIEVQNGFHVYIQNGMLTTIATGTDAAAGNVLTIVSPELKLPSGAYTQFSVTMKNTERQDSTKLTLTLTTDQGEYTYVKPVTTTEFTTYTFDISELQGVITGFRLTPTDLDCSINVEEMGFQS